MWHECPRAMRSTLRDRRVKKHARRTWCENLIADDILKCSGMIPVNRSKEVLKISVVTVFSRVTFASVCVMGCNLNLNCCQCCLHLAFTSVYILFCFIYLLFFIIRIFLIINNSY